VGYETGQARSREGFGLGGAPRCEIWFANTSRSRPNDADSKEDGLELPASNVRRKRLLAMVRLVLG
jgi:hypothetical protein